MLGSCIFRSISHAHTLLIVCLVNSDSHSALFPMNTQCAHIFQLLAAQKKGTPTDEMREVKGDRESQRYACY